MPSALVPRFISWGATSPGRLGQRSLECVIRGQGLDPGTYLYDFKQVTQPFSAYLTGLL